MMISIISLFQKNLLWILLLLIFSLSLQGQNLWKSHNPYGSQNALRRGDVITIILDENLLLNYSFELERDDKLTIKNLPDNNITKFLPKIDSSKEIIRRKKGKSKGGSKIKGNVSVLVNAVNVNGTFQIGGSKFISMDGQTNSLRISGVIHPRDLLPGYKVPSSKVANLVINFQGSLVKKRFPLRALSAESKSETNDGTSTGNKGSGLGFAQLSGEDQKIILQKYLEEMIGEFMGQNVGP